MSKKQDDYGSGPKGDGVPCAKCDRLTCDGYCDHEAVTGVSFIYLRSVPAEVKRRFKAWCAENDTNMTQKLIELMKGVYSNGSTDKPPRDQARA